jgi:ankyrin repeat protein
VTLPDIRGPFSPVFQAAYRGDVAALRRAIYAGGGVYERSSDPNVPTPLFAAVEGNHSECVAFLLAQGADYEATAKGEGANWTPLMMAVATATRPNKTMEMLLEAGANVHAQAFGGNTPLKEVASGSENGGIKKEIFALLKRYD